MMTSAQRSSTSATQAKKVNRRPRLLANTEEAAEFTGLSAFELRRGYKAGIYPAIAIGGGDKKRLRWNLDILAEAIERQMVEEQGMR